MEYRRHAKNKRHIATYNEGLLGWASADYCTAAVRRRSARTASAAARHRRSRFGSDHAHDLWHRRLFVWEDAAPSGFDESTHSNRTLSSSDFLERCFLHGNPVPTPTAVARTAVQQRIGGYNPALPHSGDMEMWMRFAAQGPIGVVAGIQGYYRKHSSSMSVQYYARLLSDWHEVIDACNDFCEKWGSRFTASESWRQQLFARLADQAFWAAGQALSQGHIEKYRACMDFAARTRPAIASGSAWRKMRLKAALGPRVVALLGKLRSGTVSNTAPDNAPGAKQIGWCPAAAATSR